MENSPKKLPKGAGKSSLELIDSGKLLDALPIKSGSIVLDLACGKGAYSIFLSGIVGDKGLVYAVDLWEEGLLILKVHMNQKGITNITPLIADATKQDQVKIDGHSVDICLMATVLHDFEEADQTDPVIKLVKNLIKPGGLLAVIEFKKIEGPPGPPLKIRLSEDGVDKIVAGYGFKKMYSAEIGEYNYLVTYKSI